MFNKIMKYVITVALEKQIKWRKGKDWDGCNRTRVAKEVHSEGMTVLRHVSNEDRKLDSWPRQSLLGRPSSVSRSMIRA